MQQGKRQPTKFFEKAAMAKYFASEVAEKVASKALEIYGGYGFIREFPAEKFYRDVKIGKIYETHQICNYKRFLNAYKEKI